MKNQTQPTKFDTLVKQILEFRDKRDWRQYHNPKNLSISIALEASELLEHFQWLNMEESRQHIRDHRDEVAEEMADVFIYLILLSDILGVDILEVALKKGKKNTKRFPIISKAK